MRYLVTGGAGFIGSHLVDQLLTDGHDVLICDNFSSGSRAYINQQAEVRTEDITCYDALAELVKGVDGVFHLAALVSVPLSVKSPQRSLNNNVVGSHNVFEAVRQNNSRAKIVYASSAAVYGHCSQMPITETAIPKPESPYGLDKLYLEQLASLFQKLYGVSSVGLRLFNVFGPRQSPDSPYSGVITKFSKKLTSEKIVTVNGSGHQTRDFIYVKDVVNAFVAAMRNESSDSEIFNVGSGNEISILMLFDILNHLLGGECQYELGTSLQGDIPRSVADTGRIYEALGFQPVVNLEEGLANTLTWMERCIND